MSTNHRTSRRVLISFDRCKAAFNLMGDHPGATLGKAFGAGALWPGAVRRGRTKPRSARAATASLAVPRAGQRLWRRCTSLVGLVRKPPVRGHCRKVGRGQKRTRRLLPALRTFVGQFTFRHWPHIGEGAAADTEIIVDRHRFPRRLFPLSQRTSPAARRRAGRCRPRRLYLSGDIGMSIPPLMCLIGPSAPGITSNAKMSVGSHNVAQALGMSTTPEMWPCTGAVPRIA
jgi:hypothetical protein